MYVERRKFLEVNDNIKQLSTIEDHFQYAIYNKLPSEIKKEREKSMLSLNNSKLLN